MKRPLYLLACVREKYSRSRHPRFTNFAYAVECLNILVQSCQKVMSQIERAFEVIAKVQSGESLNNFNDRLSGSELLRIAFSTITGLAGWKILKTF
jgi:hypothetical protein